MSGRRVGVIGGTFNPMHCGHLDMGRAAQTVLRLSEVLVIPSNCPPHRSLPLASSYHRFAMCALATISEPRWHVADVELMSPDPSFTTYTLQRLHRAGYAASELFFVLGADAFADIESWKDFPAILERSNFAVVSRPGVDTAAIAAMLPNLAGRMVGIDAADTHEGETVIVLIDHPTADVSSTAIRHRCRQRDSITGLVPDLVEKYIRQQGLYAPPATDMGTGGTASHSADRLHGQNH